MIVTSMWRKSVDRIIRERERETQREERFPAKMADPNWPSREIPGNEISAPQMGTLLHTMVIMTLPILERHTESGFLAGARALRKHGNPLRNRS